MNTLRISGLMVAIACLTLLQNRVVAQNEAPQPKSATPDGIAIPSLIDGIRQKISDSPSLAGVTILDGQIVQRVLVPGLDLKLRAEGATLVQRVKLYDAVRSVMSQDDYWKDWLGHHGVVVSYEEPPRDALDLKPVIPKSPE